MKCSWRAGLLAMLLAVQGVSVHAQRLDLNRADAAQIAQTMQGVGPVKAESIVRYRERHGPFFSVDQLTRVKGIGRKTIERNRRKIEVRPRYGE